ncbi:MAG: DUF2141 domain-containing protein [Cyclobacteriaceae bacterium]|nr:DUF2141 domain-containing protein [Cyclobacteriaceae bacterium]
MKNLIKKVAILIGVVCLSSFTHKTDETFSLTVKVNKLQNSEGVVQFALYNKDGSIPDQHYEKYYKMETSSISNGSAVITFNDLPKGTYVVNILHDENKNGKIDKGFILPKEGLGFSNYHSLGPTNRPNYKRASFKLNADTTIEVKIIYM